MTEPLWTIDTNVLVYATEPDCSLEKQGVAKALLKRLTLNPHACLLGQVLSEFMNVAVRKKAMSQAQAFDAVHLLAQAGRVLGASDHAYQQAWKLASEHKYQVWDALIISICAEHGVKTLYSEDTGSLKRPLGVHVVNPFAELEPT